MIEAVEITEHGPFGYPLTYHPPKPWVVSGAPGDWNLTKVEESYSWQIGGRSRFKYIVCKKFIRNDTGLEVQSKEELVDYWNSIGIEAIIGER